MTEQQLQRKITRYLSANNYYNFKVIAANRKGIPDVIACVDGRFIGIEVKLPHGKVSELQEYNVEEIWKSGGRAIVAYSLDDVEQFIKDIKDGK